MATAPAKRAGVNTTSLVLLLQEFAIITSDAQQPATEKLLVSSVIWTHIYIASIALNANLIFSYSSSWRGFLLYVEHERVYLR